MITLLRDNSHYYMDSGILSKIIQQSIRMKQFDWFLSVRDWSIDHVSRHTTSKHDFFVILTVYSCNLLTLFTRNMEENITELIPDWCDENFDVLARDVDEYEN